ncbi:hypothetical protein [Phaeobacter sp. B1627]|uniref:hypothetical protein n=1 Tax=Phaeobacter sp. B1627 TaxID=2583809 RepID=UPI00159ECEFE|nr:hypothetical protein [Phaeobacter sp. B1627]
MGHFLYDETHWPFCVTTAEGAISLEQHLEMLAAWDRWFDKQEPFIVFRHHLDKAALEQADGAAKATKAWLQAGARDQIKTQVRAMCILVPPDAMATVPKSSVEKVFGIPGGVFHDFAQVFDWLDHRAWFNCSSVNQDRFRQTYLRQHRSD